MNYSKFIANLAVGLIIGLGTNVTMAQESEVYEKNLGSTSIDNEMPPKWQLSVVAGGLSKHLTTKYEPGEGYTNTHSSLGMELAQTRPGWTFSAQAFHFKDSYDKNSFIAFVAFGYRVEFPYHFFVYGGAAAGIVDTNYYSGGIALPLVELGWWRISVQGSYLPQLDDTDEVIAAQFKFKVLEW